MDSLLLQILSSADIDWLLTVGTVQETHPEQISLLSKSSSNRVSFLLTGQLNVSLPHDETEQGLEIAPLSPGSPLGGVPGLETWMTSALVRSPQPVQLLTLDATKLCEQLVQDCAFAAHFYQFLSLFLLHRLRALIMQFKLLPSMVYELNVKETASLFAELQDSHLDWISAVGQPLLLPSGAVLKSAGYPIDALYIVLEGAFSLSVPPEPSLDLPQVFIPEAQPQIQWQELVRLGRGDVFGEMRLLQSQPAVIPQQMVQATAIRDAEILTIPSWRIQAKLLHDVEFAAHFYRVMTTLMANKYQTLLTRLGFVFQVESQSTSSDRLLTQMARAETKFEWMVQRVQTKVIARRTA